MDNQRSKKTRSVGADLTSTRHSTSGSNNLTRPDHSDKHRSVPVVVPRRPSETSRESEDLNRSKRQSKASSRDDATARSSVSASHSSIARSQRSSALSVKTNTQPTDGDEIPTFTFAVIGNSSVGKSVFIRNALDLRRPSTTHAAKSKVLLGGLLYRLHLIEVPLDSVDTTRSTILWSSIPELQEAPDVDGVLCLYDVSEKDSLEGVPQLLTALEKMNKTTCLVSCKVDVPLDDQEVGPSFIDRVSTRFPKISVEEARFDLSDTAKRCLLKILNETLVVARRESRLPPRTRSRSNDPSSHPPRRSSQKISNRSRSRSKQQAMRSRSRENTLDVSAAPMIESSDEEATDEDSAGETGPHHDRNIIMPMRTSATAFRPRAHIEKPQTPMSSTENVSTRPLFLSERASRVVPQTPESFADPSTLRRGSADTAGSKTGKTFLDIDDESPAGDTSPSRANLADSQNSVTTEDLSHQGVSFGDLVDRLLSKPISKADHKFIHSFLCLYRVFATPTSLLTSIVDRFLETEESDVVVFAKASDLLRYLSVLGLWTAQYPGDFAELAVRNTISAFVNDLEKNKSFAPAARQIANNLQTYLPDEDEDWTFVDKDCASNKPRNRSSQQSQHSQSKSDIAQAMKRRQRYIRNTEDTEDSDFDDNLVTPSTTRHSAATSSASSLQKSSQGSNHASENLRQLNQAREKARKLRVVPQRLVTKLECHLFLSFSVEELAVEITRMDWTMYTAIRPRDFVRYVTIPSSQRTQLGRVDYIGMMTKHFNHLALFVSGMILLRDKPKHRARVVEKFMDLAWKVRQMNNYHALGAIVAALSGEEIVRLSQTHELIPQEKHKQFLRLKILMGHQKSHAAYRMAWENSSSERIPYLPRIQEDLTKAAQGNSTFTGCGNVNWKKFEIMGDTIVSIQRSQEKAYKFPDRTARGHEIDGLILETKMLEGEDGFDPQQELYERSKLLEPPVTGGGAEKKKFDWLRR